MSPIRTICAWCPDFDPRDTQNDNVSHGICPTCYARVFAEDSEVVKRERSARDTDQVQVMPSTARE